MNARPRLGQNPDENKIASQIPLQCSWVESVHTDHTFDSKYESLSSQKLAENRTVIYVKRTVDQREYIRSICPVVQANPRNPAHLIISHNHTFSCVIAKNQSKLIELQCSANVTDQAKLESNKPNRPEFE